MSIKELLQSLLFEVPDLQQLAWVLVVFSLLVLLISLVIVPVVIIYLPENYLCSKPGQNDLKTRFGYWYWIIFPLKNLLGLICLILGCVMLITPGQGLLTILIGLMLVNFPGKPKLIRSLLSRPSLLNSINWTRKLAHQPPLIKPDDSSSSGNFE